MMSPLIQTQVAGVPQVSDIRIVPFTFAATEILLEAVTEKGRVFFASIFGAGAISIMLPKSKAFDFERFANQKGITVG